MKNMMTRFFIEFAIFNISRQINLGFIYYVYQKIIDKVELLIQEINMLLVQQSDRF